MHENDALSDKLTHALNSTTPLSTWPREGTGATEEEVIIAMSQVQLREIQIYELNLEIEKLRKAKEDNHKIYELKEEVKELR